MEKLSERRGENGHTPPLSYPWVLQRGMALQTEPARTKPRVVGLRGAAWAPRSVLAGFSLLRLGSVPPPPAESAREPALVLRVVLPVSAEMLVAPVPAGQQHKIGDAVRDLQCCAPCR